VLCLLVAVFFAYLHSAEGVVSEQPNTALAIAGDWFTINGQPVFLLGFSYFSALGSPEDFISRDLDDFQRRGFNWLRVWATWRTSDFDMSAFDSDGQVREPFLAKLKWLVAECDRRALVVDVTLARCKPTARAGIAGRLAGLAAHQRAIETLVLALKTNQNWYLDLANERDVQDDRYVPPAELKQLREQIRNLDPQRLVTASTGGHDLTPQDLREASFDIGLDFVTPHRPRDRESPGQTEIKTHSALATMKDLHRIVPILYQEPFRRGYGSWEPLSTDFFGDLRGAFLGGSAGWCFHNGSQRGVTESRTGHSARSFDLRHSRLMDQLDAEELHFIGSATNALAPAAKLPVKN
jgi:hypothetical protein